jgi:hypothetical protein
MKMSFIRTGLIYLATLLIVSGCSNLIAQPEITETGDDVIYTQAAQTVSAALTEQAAGTQAVQATLPPETASSATLPSPVESSPTPTLVAVTSTPAPTAGGTCTDKAVYVNDVTIPDGTTFLPGEKFVKTWRLRNAGTCTWTTGYALIFAGGDPMSGVSPVSLRGDVPPESTVDISVELTAPASDGLYKGNWQLRNADGKNFGIGENADKPFFVEINVGGASSGLDLGSPDWQDSFDSASNWYLLETPNTRFEVEDGHMIMTSFDTGKAEEWGLSSRPGLTDFYLEVTFKTSDKCSGLDRYGVLVRSPDPNMGYVFGFSCDGRFRLYKWDGENYQGIQEWKRSAEILSGPNQTNRLGIWLDGETIRLYANRRLLGEYTDDAYDEGRFGLFIGSSDTEDLVVYVEDAAYWILKD